MQGLKVLGADGEVGGWGVKGDAEGGLGLREAE